MKRVASCTVMKNVKVQMEVPKFTHINGDTEGSGAGHLLLKSPATVEVNVKFSNPQIKEYTHTWKI